MSRALRPTRGHCAVERACDGVRLTVTAPTLAALFTGAARAMSEQLGALLPGEAHATPPTETHQLSVVATNAGDLLAGWLCEILFHSRQAGRLFGAATVHRVTPRHLRGELRAEHDTRWFVDPMSMSLTEARIEAGSGGRLVARIALKLRVLARSPA